MRKLLLFLLLFASICGKANATSFSMLNEVNAEWKNNSDGQLLAASFNTSSNKSFNDWIATHLMLVEQTLRQRTVQHLSASQKENRFKLLNELNAYWHARTFPVNDYLPYKNPVFIDRIGTHCAVGYLMQQSGAESLARAIDADNKFVYVKAIKTKGVSEWAFENGFTIDELAWIQPGYPVSYNAADMGGGLNGSVKTMIVDSTSQLIYAGGSFNASNSGVSCNGIAVYKNITGWNWVGLGSGVNGTVNTMLIYNNKLYVGGEFTMAGSVPALNVAVYDLNLQQWQSIGNLDSTVNSLAVYNNEIYAGGKFTGFVSKWTGTQWQDITSGFIYGEEVRTLESWNNNLLIGGNFELATGAIRKNVATYDGTQMGASGFGTITPVNDFEIYRDTIYAACDVVVGIDTCAIARFVNSDWEVLLKPYGLVYNTNSFNGTTVQHLSVAYDRLFGVGDFTCGSFMYFGRGIMELYFPFPGSLVCKPLIRIGSMVRTMVPYGSVIAFGGDFISPNSGDTLNYVGQLYNVINGVSVIEKNSTNSIVVFPNPATEKINFQLNDFSTQKACYVKILDEVGHEVFVQKINQQVFSVDFTGKSEGIYILHILDGEGVAIGSKRVVVW